MNEQNDQKLTPVTSQDNKRVLHAEHNVEPTKYLTKNFTTFDEQVAFLQKVLNLDQTP